MMRRILLINIDRVKLLISQTKCGEVNIVELNALLDDIKYSCNAIDIHKVRDKELVRVFEEIVNL